MYSFRLINTLTGWVVFLVAAATYVCTVEPVGSFWDCGEFIAASHKLLIGHPPGAPVYMLLTHVFTDLLASSPATVAYWANVFSALCSAFTILFLFWTITRLCRKLMPVTGTTYTPTQTVGMMTAGIVGSLVYAFSDSFWFSAVEAEVYALSSFFTAFGVWAVLKWESLTNESEANRWLILIAYTMGLSIGTHLLNLVTLPALALVVYFRYFKPTFWGGVVAFVVGGIVVLLLMQGMRITLPGLAGKMDVLFVNSLGLPFGSGLMVFLVLFLGGLVYGIWYSVHRKKMVLNTVLLCVSFILIGYSSYTMLVIRANFNPPFNLNNPKDIPGFMYYMNMEQYGAGRPLVYGPVFTAEVVEVEKGDPIYVKGKDTYETYSQRYMPRYDPQRMTLFPRMYSDDAARRHPQQYREIAGLREGENPTLADEWSYFLKHQLGYFYGRYFCWNFIGRDSDEQGAGWLTTLQPKQTLPPVLSQNKGHNRFYGLPLLLGILGFWFLWQRHQQLGIFTITLFFMTGMALVLYLNVPPSEPRERDYIYVGSFYAFAIWIGLGVVALQYWLQKVVKNVTISTAVAALACAVVPVGMVSQTWDDHNRSGRYMALDSARNMLESCAPNAILFTTGDNDTYPLLYAQEVEGIRLDVRVVISQFMGIDWYIEHLKQSLGRTGALDVSLERKNYISSINNQILFYENQTVKDGMNVREYLNLIRQDNPALKITLDSGETINTLPSNRLYLPLDKQAILKSGMIPADLQELLTDRFELELPKKHLYKDDLIFLDILTQNNWKRPLYFSTTQLPQQYNLMEYTQLEGVVSRLLPVKVSGAKNAFMDTHLAYHNLVEVNQWRGLNNPEVYHDETCRGERLTANRLAFLTLAQQLLADHQPKKAREVLRRSLNFMPPELLHDDYLCSLYVAPLLQAGETQKAQQLAAYLTRRSDQNLNYYWEQHLTDRQTIGQNLAILNTVATAFRENSVAQKTSYDAVFEKHMKLWQY